MPSVPSAPGAAELGRKYPAEILGIGFPYIPALPPDLYRVGLLDFVEVTPETLCRVRRDGQVSSMDLIPDRVDIAKQRCGELPIVVHGVELSIGSAGQCSSAYLDMLERFQALWPFYWHSEHLSYQTIPGEDGAPLDIGVPLPLPGTEEAVNLVARRAFAIGRHYGVPFLLENPAHYLADLPYDREIADEFGLMTTILDRGGCGQLLDLHNLYCNAINFGYDMFSAIDRIELDRVIEIHVAGGRRQDGFWMDAHDSRVPAPVWDLLEYTLPRCRNAAGVVFELLEAYASNLSLEEIAQELIRLREVWRRLHPRLTERISHSQ
jgi:uncharacterized protein